MDFGKKKESCQVKVVECTCFRGRGVTCERISANEIVLHDGCIVDVIECDGTLKYDESCRVGSINGDCMVVKED